MSLMFPNLVPGAQAIRESVERDLLWGEVHDYALDSVVLLSTTVDARSTVTTELQPGLCLGQITSSSKYTHYDHDATDGTASKQLCLLAHPVNMLDAGGTARDQVAVVIIKGLVRNGQCGGLDQQFRAASFPRFLFDDVFSGNSAGWRDVVAKTANYTVTAADNNTIFTNQGASGAVVFTLPTIAKGLRYRFYGEAAQNISISSAAVDTLVVFNDAAADTIALNTSNEIIGGCVEVYANADATKWLTFEMVHDGQTTVIAT